MGIGQCYGECQVDFLGLVSIMVSVNVTCGE